MLPKRTTLRFAAFMLCLLTPACGDSATGEEDADEGALFGWGGKTASVSFGRTVVSDGVLTRALSVDAAKNVTAGRSDPELSGGLVRLAGGTFERVHYGIQCTNRDGTCVVKWLSRTEQGNGIVFAGELGKNMSAVFGANVVEGEAVRVACADGACTVTFTNADAAAKMRLETVTLDEADLTRFAGL